VHEEPQYTVDRVKRGDPMHAKGYRFVVLSPGNIPIAHFRTEKEAEHDADSRNVHTTVDPWTRRPGATYLTDPTGVGDGR
jgi:hypothetical protein